jgi:hypothetical protein
MDRLLEHCLLLRATFSELQGGAGRRHHISDVDDWPSWGPTESWRGWESWLEEPPYRFGAYVLARCEPLREAVLAIRGIRAELAASTWTSPILRRAFATHLEREVLGRPWLVDLDDGDIVGSGPDAPWYPSGELYLVTLPTPLAALDGLVTMAKEAIDAGALVGRQGAEERKRRPRGVGRTPLAATQEGAALIVRIKAMKEARATWAQISAAMEKEFPHLKPFSSARVRAIFERESGLRQPSRRIKPN